MKTKFLRILSSFALMFAFGFTVQAQSISGTVTDEKGVPLPGATVLVEGTQNGVSTDFDGNYQSMLQAGTLLFLVLLVILLLTIQVMLLVVRFQEG